MTIEFGVFEKPGKEWDEFAERQSNLLFYQSIWAETLKKGLNIHPLYYYVKEGKDIVAGMPVVVFNLGLLRLAYSTIFYGNMIGESREFHYLCQEMERDLSKRRVDQVRVIDSPFGMAGQPPTMEPFYSARETGVLIDLKGMDNQKLLSSYDHYLRRDIGRARRNGIEVKEAVFESDFESFYELYLSAMRRNHAPAKYSRRLLHAFRDLAFSNQAGLFLAKKDGKPLSGILLLYSEDVAHAVMAGSDPGAFKLYPNKLLIHEALCHCIEEEFDCFDFGAASNNDRPLIRFKMMFGGRRVPILTYVKNYSPLKCWLWEKAKPYALRLAKS